MIHNWKVNTLFIKKSLKLKGIKHLTRLIFKIMFIAKRKLYCFSFFFLKMCKLHVWLHFIRLLTSVNNIKCMNNKPKSYRHFWFFFFLLLEIFFKFWRNKHALYYLFCTIKITSIIFLKISPAFLFKTGY